MTLFTNNPPSFTHKEAIQIMDRFYSQKGTIKDLYSDRDQNFLFISGHKKYLLKIFNSIEKRQVIDMQIASMNHILNSDFPFKVPEPINNLKIINRNGDNYYVCLFKYMEGKFLFESKLKKNQYRNMGSLMGSLTKTLNNFDHPGGHRTFEWDLQNIDLLFDRVKHVKEKSGQKTIYHFFNNFNDRVSPLIGYLRKSIIHNDGNDHNIIMYANGNIKGIIDFGDMVYSYTVLEAAVCMAYIGQNNKNPLNNMERFLNGYQSIFPLRDEEIRCLIQMVCIRLCISVTMAAWRKTIFPSNSYLTISEKSSWALLDYLKTKDLDNCATKLISNKK